MRVSTILATIAAAASFASASAIVARQGFPSCSVPCLGTGDLGGCDVTDNTCLCKNNAYIAASTACIKSACSTEADYTQATNTAVQLCKAAGVDITGSASSAAASASSQVASVSAATASASSSVAAASSAAASVASSASASAAASTTAAANAAGVLTAGKGALVGGLALVAAIVL